MPPQNSFTVSLWTTKLSLKEQSIILVVNTLLKHLLKTLKGVLHTVYNKTEYSPGQYH